MVVLLGVLVVVVGFALRLSCCWPHSGAILTAVPAPNRLGTGVSVRLESRAPSEQHIHVRQDCVAELGHQCGASRQGPGRGIAPGVEAVLQLHIR